MTEATVTMVRIYLTEGDHILDRLLRRLHHEEQVRGVTAFRGIAGYGASGRLHTTSLVELSLDLPLVVEFFDAPERVTAILDDLSDLLEQRPVVTWPATSLG